MEVRALCIRLLRTTMILLCANDQKVDAVFLHIAPNRSQFFEYESVTFYCEGVSYCDVHKVKGKLESCSNTNKRTTTGSSCTVKNIYTDDSGEYWYETGGEKISNILNLTVTAGSVILESPALPVIEGEDVTLCCRNKMTFSNFTADFYKDGRHIYISSTGNMTIHRVSKSDKGLYKCSISGAGGSPESWLIVADSKSNPDSEAKANLPSSASTPWIIITVLLFILLVVVGLHHYGRDWWENALHCLLTRSHTSGSTEDQTVSAEASAANTNRATYATVTKNKKKKEENRLSSRPIYYTLGDTDTQVEEPGSFTIAHTSSGGIYQPTGDDPFYSIIQ